MIDSQYKVLIDLLSKLKVALSKLEPEIFIARDEIRLILAKLDLHLRQLFPPCFHQFEL